jgi:hypothetical protein
VSIVSAGSLTVVGTGIELGGHMTPQAQSAWERSEVALYLMADPLTMAWLEELNPSARSLHRHYQTGQPRREAYEAMIEEILAPAREGRRTCAAFYGHPGLFVYPGHEAVRRARAEGLRARMQPAISSLDCLFADLGIDAGFGCQIYHATDFLANRTRPDTTATLLLLQIGVIGHPEHLEQPDWSRLPVLADYLAEFYPAEHELIGYEASPYVVANPIVERCPLSKLAEARLSGGMTLVVPRADPAEPDPTMMDRLGMPR